jgi:hypothetical protein
MAYGRARRSTSAQGLDRESVTVRIDDNLTQFIETKLVPGDVPALEISVKPAFRSGRGSTRSCWSNTRRSMNSSFAARRHPR